MAKIEKQKVKRELSPEEQAIVNAINEQKKKLSEIRKAKAEENAKYRNARTMTMFAVISFIERSLKAGGKGSAELIQAVLNDVKPTDTISQEKAEAIKSAIGYFNSSNQKK